MRTQPLPSTHHHHRFLPRRRINGQPHSRRLEGLAGHGAGGVVLAPGPQIAADLGGLAERHADARATEEGVGGPVVFAEVEVHVGA